jgi:hypothetical protein
MKKLFLLLLVFVTVTSCNSNTKLADDDKTENKKPKPDDEDDADDETTDGWSTADRNKVKTEWNRTFSGIKEKVQETEGFDESRFDKDAKKVISCTQEILEGKYASYAAYKKGVQNGDMQRDPTLFNKLGDCQQDFMDKYNNGAE